MRTFILFHNQRRNRFFNILACVKCTWDDRQRSQMENVWFFKKKIICYFFERERSLNFSVVFYFNNIYSIIYNNFPSKYNEMGRKPARGQKWKQKKGYLPKIKMKLRKILFCLKIISIRNILYYIPVRKFIVIWSSFFFFLLRIIIIKSYWKNIIACKLFLSDRNTWNTSCKNIIK